MRGAPRQRFEGKCARACVQVENPRSLDGAGGRERAKQCFADPIGRGAGFSATRHPKGA